MSWIWEVYQDGGEEPNWDIQEDAKMKVLLRQDVTRQRPESILVAKRRVHPVDECRVGII